MGTRNNRHCHLKVTGSNRPAICSIPEPLECRPLDFKDRLPLLTQEHRFLDIKEDRPRDIPGTLPPVPPKTTIIQVFRRNPAGSKKWVVPGD